MEIFLPCLELLGVEEPLEAVRSRVQGRLASTAGMERALPSMQQALLSVLTGQRAEVEPALAQARAALPVESGSLLELGAALVMKEAGHALRTLGAVELAEAQPGVLEQPEARVTCRVLHAQALLLRGEVELSARASREVLAELASQAVPQPVRRFALLAAAECLLAAGDGAGTAGCLEQWHTLPACPGLLGARAQVLQVRLGLARGQGEGLRALLEQALARLTWLGAARDVGLACLTLAHVVAAEGGGEPAHWLARAQPWLTRAGTAADLRLLREGLRTFGRRQVDRLADEGLLTVAEALREHHARLEDALLAQRDVASATRGMPQPLGRTVDGLLAALATTGEQLVGHLERTLLDREQFRRLVTASQHLAAQEGLEPLLEALPRLALTFVLRAAAALVEVNPSGALRVVGGSLAPAAVPLERLQPVVAAALREGRPQVLAEEPGALLQPRALSRPLGGRSVLVPLPQSGLPLVLVVARMEPEVPLDERDLGLLSLFGSLAGSTLARARANAALERSAARDAATLAAIRNGVLTLELDGTVSALNQAAAQLLHVSQAQVLGRRLQHSAALAPLAEVLGSGRVLSGEVVSLPHGEVLVHTHPYEGGTVVTLQEPAAVRRLAHKITGSAARFTFEDLAGQDPALCACLEDARRAARSDVPLLITGESGTGKEMLAQAIHRASARASLPFIGINVAAFPRELLESELFGYERGAFTGARAGGHPGKFELAERGTLLLDEIGDMPLDMQVKLLRVLQERAVQRLGGSRDIPVQARIIATTHRDLEQAVREGTFRLDLFHRLRVVHLRLPPLRERRADIPLLVEHHLRRHATHLGRRRLSVSPQVMEALLAYDWPGNVRELANVLEGAASLLPEGQSTITRIPPSIARALEQPPSPQGTEPLVPEDRVLPLEEVERRAFEHALRACQGNVARAAKALGVAKATFYSRLRRYGFMEAEPRGPAAEPTLSELRN